MRNCLLCYLAAFISCCLNYDSIAANQCVVLFLYDNDTQISNEWELCDEDGSLMYKHKKGDYEIRLTTTYKYSRFFYYPDLNEFVIPEYDTITVEIKRCFSGEEKMKITLYNIEAYRESHIYLNFNKGEYFVELNSKRFKRAFENATFFAVDKENAIWNIECSPEVLSMTTAIHNRKTVVGKDMLYRRYGRRYRKTGKIM